MLGSTMVLAERRCPGGGFCYDVDFGIAASSLGRTTMALSSLATAEDPRPAVGVVEDPVINDRRNLWSS